MNVRLSVYISVCYVRVGKQSGLFESKNFRIFYAVVLLQLPLAIMEANRSPKHIQVV